MGTGVITVFAVASPYAWDVLASAERRDLTVVAVDNRGDADPRLPLGDARSGTPFVLGLASAPGRAAAANEALATGFRDPIALVDPTAVVAPTVVVAHGSYLNAGVVVGSHARIGCHVNLNRSSSIGHDCDLGFAVSIGPGAVLSGHVVVEALATIGAGAVILPQRRIGHGATVGAGAVVTRDVAPGATVAGNPAAVLAETDPGVAAICPHCAAA